MKRTVPFPLYYQIKQQLKAAIESNELVADETLPSERELVELFGVSRPTVRQATEELLNEGYLYRRRGLGTFIAHPKLKQELPSVLSFTEQMHREGKTASSRVVSKEVLEKASPAVYEALKLPASSPIFQLKRLRLTDDEPFMLETTSLPLAQFPKLTEIDFGKASLYQFLQEEYNVTIGLIYQTLEPILLKEPEAKLLGVLKGSPAMLLQISAFTPDKHSIEFSQALVRGDRCQYFLKLEVDNHDKGAHLLLQAGGHSFK